MKHSILVKFVAIFLAAVSLVGAMASVAAIAAIERAGLYVNSLDELQGQQMDAISSDIAKSFTRLYAVKTFSNMTYSMRVNRYSDPEERADSAHWTLKLQQGDTVLEDPGDVSGYAVVRQYTITPMYPIISLLGPNDRQEPETTVPPVTAPPTAAPGGTPADNGRQNAYSGTEVPENYLYYDAETVWDGGPVTYYFYYFEAPEYTVTVYMQEDVLESSSLHVLTALYPIRYGAIAVLALGLLFFAIGMVLLCWSAGRDRDGEVRPGGLNRIPLDLYAAVTALGEYFLITLFLQLADWTMDAGPHSGNLSLLAANLLGIVLLGMAFVFAFAAQVKVKGGFWWHHSVTGICCGAAARAVRAAIRGIGALLGMLNVLWRWLLTAVAMAFGVVITFLIFIASMGNEPFEWICFCLFLLSLGLCVVIVCYGGYCYGVLLSGVQKMSRGDLTHQINTRYLRGDFREFAQQLNDLSDTAKRAAQRQLRSERMKTELITNVSHDIKTPLTSIINFVDLLQKPHTPEERRQYLEVLSRQSNNMKRLIEDLMELSKANTGNMQVNIVPIDAAEAVNQALGEFDDKLTSAQLTPVFRQPEEPVTVLADGRLMWRVMSNLLSNTVKYAMPGTRLYVDLLRSEDQVLLSLKNVSRAELRGSAEELMERFVQGDASRSAEGSGLGLNIAQSLMEVQGGKLHLMLDGDLFKVTLVFPAGQ
jgi:signal transduction histidine kinase